MDVGKWTASGEWSATPELDKTYREIRTLVRAGRNWQS